MSIPFSYLFFLPLTISCSLYAAPFWFTKNFENDAQQCELLQRVQDLIYGTSRTWRPVKSPKDGRYFIGLVNIKFARDEKKDQYTHLLTNKKNAMANDIPAIYLKNIGNLFLVHTNPETEMKYYIGGRTTNIFVEVSQEQHANFNQKRQKPSEKVSLKKIREFLKKEYENTDELKALAVCFTAGRVFTRCIVSAKNSNSFFIYWDKHNQHEVEQQKVINEEFSKLQAIQKNKTGYKMAEEYTLAETETCKYVLSKRNTLIPSNASLCITFKDPNDFKSYIIKNKNILNTPKSSHSLKEKINILSFEEAEKAREKYDEYIKIIRQDVKKIIHRPYFASFYVLSRHRAHATGLLQDNEKGYTILKSKYSIFSKNQHSQDHLVHTLYTNKENNWTYYSLPTTLGVYIKVPSDVGEIFKEIQPNSHSKKISITSCKAAILKDIPNSKDAEKLEKLFNIKDSVFYSDNIKYFTCCHKSNHTLRVYLRNTEHVEALLSEKLSGLQYHYALGNSNKSRIGWIEISNITNLDTLRKKNTEALVKEEESPSEGASGSDDSLSEAMNVAPQNVIIKQEEPDSPLY